MGVDLGQSPARRLRVSVAPRIAPGIDWALAEMARIQPIDRALASLGLGGENAPVTGG